MNDTPVLLIDPPLDRPAHWDGVQRIMRKLKEVFVNPYRMLVDGFRDGWMMQGFLTYVRAAEKEARRGLLRDALEIAPTLSEAQPARANASSRSRGDPSQEQPLAEDFRAWRVRFAVVPMAAKPNAARPHDREGAAARRAELQRRHDEFWFAPASAPRTDYKLFDLLQRTSLRACALRFEAVRRVMENPAPHALRLARRLRAQADAALALAFLSIEPDFEYDHHDEQVAHCRPLIGALWPAVADTS